MENQLLDLNRESKVNEAQFFDQIKEAFHSKQLYENFLVCLALFNQDIITRPQLIALVEPSLSIFANLYKKFKDYVENRLLIVPTRDFELINENIYLCKRYEKNHFLIKFFLLTEFIFDQRKRRCEEYGL